MLSTPAGLPSVPRVRARSIGTSGDYKAIQDRRAIPANRVTRGPPGPSGVSYGAYTYNDATKDMLASGGYEVVASATLPPGDYLVVGTTLAWPDGSDFIDCRIDDGAYYSSSHSEGETIAVTDHVFLSQQGNVTFQCRSEDGDASSYVFQGSLSVIKLNQVAVSFRR